MHNAYLIILHGYKKFIVGKFTLWKWGNCAHGVLGCSDLKKKKNSK